MRRNPRDPLTEAQWQEIRLLVAAKNLSIKQIAMRYNVSPAHIRKNCPSDTKLIRETADLIIEADTPAKYEKTVKNLRQLDKNAHVIVASLVDDLKQVTANLVTGAVSSSQTFAHLSHIAAQHAMNVHADLHDPDVLNHAKRAMALTQTANLAAESSLKMLGAGHIQVSRENDAAQPELELVIPVTADEAVRTYQKLLEQSKIK